MRAGSSVQKLIFPEGFFPTEGFTHVIDTLHARVLVLEAEERCALCVLEMTSIPPEEIDAIGTIVRRETGADHAWVLAVHTFSAPHFMPDHVLKTEEQRRAKRQLQELVYAAVTGASREAAAGLKEVKLSVGTAECLVNSARDVETPDGWWILNNGEGPADHAMTVLRMDDAQGKPAAMMVHYSVQSSVLDGSMMGGGKAVSGDLAGRMTAALEEKYGCPVLFLIGAAGDQAPREKAVGFALENGLMKPTDMGEAVLPVLEKLSAEMTAAAEAAAAAAVPAESGTLYTSEIQVTVPAKKIERDLHKLHPTRIPPYEPDGEDAQPVTLLQIGALKLIGVKPELNCVTAQQICGGDPMVRVVTLWNGGAKYMADAASCDRITYESQNSPFMKGAAEKMAAVAEKLLGR